ncbi:TPM domain containing protein [Trichuris trichiura]|uniref:TPM domain containing protein n=1 Tax=Trichuris trichiura TaxID=36087 RepID=A0A077Z3N8_TRITR|nr:TPM domain containing protein [Trichuris trichiura]
MLVNGISVSFNQLTLMILCFCPRSFSDWTAKTYPDLRSEAFECGDHLPRHSFLCDPDHLLTREDAESVNRRLYELAVSTPCQCQRRSQCIAVGPDGNQFYVGFVTTVALVRKLKTSSMDPADNQALTVAEKFARAVRNRWALGDCDNSALILIWESQSILHIATDRVTKLYVTEKEIHQIQAHLADLIYRKAYLRALELILDILRNEYSGMPEEHVDTGTLSLIVSIAVAGILGLIITGKHMTKQETRHVTITLSRVRMRVSMLRKSSS